MHPNRTVWMTHWMQKRCKTAPSRVCEDQTVHTVCKEGDRGTRQGQLVFQNAEYTNTKLLDTDSGKLGISESHRKWRCEREGACEGPQRAKQVVPETQTIVVKKELLMHDPRKMNPLNVEAALLDASDVHKVFGSSLRFESFKKFAFPHFNTAQSEQLVIPKFDSKQKMDILAGLELAICSGTGGVSGSVVGKSRPRLVHKSLDLPCTESMRKDHHREEVMYKTPQQQIRTSNVLERTLPHKRSWQDDYVGSTSGSQLHGFKALEANRKCRIGGLVNRDNLANDHFTPMELECGNCGNCSAFLAYNTKTTKRIDANGPESPCSGPKGEVLQINGDASTGDFHLPSLVGDLSRSIQNVSAARSLGDHNTLPSRTALEDTKCRFYPLHKMPTCSLHDIEMLRISGTADSMEEVAGGLPKFMKTTHHLLITKKTDLNLSKGDHMIRESITDFEGNVSGKTIGHHPAFHCCSNHEAVFQYIGDGGNPAKSVFSCTNVESSAETEALPVDAYQSRYSPEGVTPSQLHKDVMVRSDAEQFTAKLFSPSKDFGICHAVSERPAVNEELSLALAQEFHVENRELSESRTESFDAEHLLSHLEQPENSHISPWQGGCVDPAQSNRWVKRLRSGASDSFAFANKSLKMGDASSGDNVNELFGRGIVACSKTSSEPTSGKCLISSQRRSLDKAMLSLKNRESSLADSVKDFQDLSTYSWIQRWRRNRDWRSQERPIPKVVCDPNSSKVASKEASKVAPDLPRKQFPSIAAMALMRKAVNNFSPCEFRKNESFVVWSTNGLITDGLQLISNLVHWQRKGHW
ncbi:hypothetical protein ACLOJK_001819 [Asimina triloba]